MDYLSRIREAFPLEFSGRPKLLISATENRNVLQNPVSRRKVTRRRASLEILSLFVEITHHVPCTDPGKPSANPNNLA